MNSIAATLLILGASASATRQMDVENETIGGIVWQVVKGAVEDVLGRSDRRAGLADALQQVTKPRLTIDGRPCSGVFAWLAAIDRVAGYALDRRTEGSVGYRYRLRVRGLDVCRDTRIADGHVLLTTSTGWTERVPITRRITREVPVHVTIRIEALERLHATLLVGTATGTADLSDFRCAVVRNRIAEPRASEALGDGLSAALLAVERRGKDWFDAGQFSQTVNELRPLLRAALNVRLRP